MDRLSSFECIPREILELILDYLDQWTRPERNLRVQPKPEVFTAAPTATLSLKSLSLVSKSFHHAVLPRLFRHIRIVQSTSPPAYTEVPTDPFSWIGEVSDLASSLNRHALGSFVQSFTLRVEGFYPVYYRSDPDPSEDEWILNIEKQWQKLLRLISASLRKLTILASPYHLGMLLSIKLDPYVNEALHMPYHLLVLEKPGLLLTAKDSGTANPDVSSSISKIKDLQWTSLLLNEGSFL